MLKTFSDLDVIAFIVIVVIALALCSPAAAFGFVFLLLIVYAGLLEDQKARPPGVKFVDHVAKLREANEIAAPPPPRA